MKINIVLLLLDIFNLGIFDFVSDELLQPEQPLGLHPPDRGLLTSLQRTKILWTQVWTFLDLNIFRFI